MGFRKSSFCAFGGCVETEAPKFKTPSACAGGACTEVAVEKEGVLVRHSENPDLVLSFSLKEWGDFVAGVKNGEFDL